VNRAAHSPSTRSLIPQHSYVPSRTRGGFTPAEPVLFFVDGVPGISLSRALVGGCAGLDGGNDSISSFENSKVMCRTQVGTTVLPTGTSPTFSLVRRTRFGHIQGEEPSTRPEIILLMRFPDKHSTPQYKLDTDNALQASEGGWEEGEGVHRGECSLDDLECYRLLNTTMCRNKDCKPLSLSKGPTSLALLMFREGLGSRNCGSKALVTRASTHRKIFPSTQRMYFPATQTPSRFHCTRLLSIHHNL